MPESAPEPASVPAPKAAQTPEVVSWRDRVKAKPIVRGPPGPVRPYVKTSWFSIPKGKVPLGGAANGFGVYVTPQLKARIADFRRRAAAGEEITPREMQEIAVAVMAEMLESGKPSQVGQASRALHEWGRKDVVLAAARRGAKFLAMPSENESLGEIPGPEPNGASGS